MTSIEKICTNCTYLRGVLIVKANILISALFLNRTRLGPDSSSQLGEQRTQQAAPGTSGMNRQTGNSTGCYRNIRWNRNRELNRLLQEHQVWIDKQGIQQAATGTSGMNRQKENSTGCSRNISYELTNRKLIRLLQEHQVWTDKQWA